MAQKLLSSLVLASSLLVFIVRLSIASSFLSKVKLKHALFISLRYTLSWRSLTSILNPWEKTTHLRKFCITRQKLTMKVGAKISSLLQEAVSISLQELFTNVSVDSMLQFSSTLFPTQLLQFSNLELVTLYKEFKIKNEINLIIII